MKSNNAKSKASCQLPGEVFCVLRCCFSFCVFRFTFLRWFVRQQTIILLPAFFSALLYPVASLAQFPSSPGFTPLEAPASGGAAPTLRRGLPLTGFTVSPIKVPLELKRGEAYRGVFQVVNRSESPLPLLVYLQNFAARDEEGNIAFSADIFGGELPNPRLWFTVDRPDLLLDAGASRAVPYTLSIPEDAAFGTHLVATIFQSKFPQPIGTGAQAQLLPAISALFFIDVIPAAGEARPDTGRLEIAGFTISPDARSSLFGASLSSILNLKRLSFVERAPITFLIRIRNDSRFIARPEGAVRITNLWGGEVGLVPFPSGGILPGAARKYAVTFAGPLRLGSLSFAPSFLRESFFPGRYRARLLIESPDGRQTKGSLAFWAFPKLFTGVVLMPLVALLFVLFRYRRRILASFLVFFRGRGPA